GRPTGEVEPKVHTHDALGQNVEKGAHVVPSSVADRNDEIGAPVATSLDEPPADLAAVARPEVVVGESCRHEIVTRDDLLDSAHAEEERSGVGIEDVNDARTDAPSRH